jgi:hypothetical protein
MREVVFAVSLMFVVVLVVVEVLAAFLGWK